MNHMLKDLSLMRQRQEGQAFVQIEPMGKYTIVHGIFPIADLSGIGFFSGRSIMIALVITGIYLLGTYLFWNMILKFRGTDAILENDDAEQALYLDEWAKTRYKPNPQAELAEEVSRLLIAENTLVHLKDFTMNGHWREHSMDAGRTFCAEKISTVIKALKDQEEILPMLDRMRKDVLSEGYSIEFKNDLVVVSSVVRKIKLSKMREYDQKYNGWTCPACGSDGYKLLDGKKQCQKCGI